MKRIGLLLIAAVPASVTLTAPPASAGTEACTSTGTANLSTGFGIPPFGPTTADFNIHLQGPCLPSLAGDITATGVVTGFCGLFSGHGVATAHGQDHRFALVGAGAVLLLTGEVVGTMSAVEDPLDAGDCTNMGARQFQITGEETFNHLGCSLATTTTVVGTTVHTCVP